MAEADGQVDPGRAGFAGDRFRRVRIAEEQRGVIIADQAALALGTGQGGGIPESWSAYL